MLYRKALICLALVASAAAFAPAVTAAPPDETFVPIAAISLPNGQVLHSFDISFVDPFIGLYVLGDRTNQSVDVVDTTTNTLLTQLQGGFVGFKNGNDTSGPDGVLIVGHRELWVGDAPCDGSAHPTACSPTGPSSVKVLSLFTGHVTHVISTDGSARADELCVDPRHHLVMVANNADNPPFASLISTTTYSVVKKIPFDGTNNAPNSNNGAEQCQWDRRTGMFYISIPGIAGQPDGTGGVAVIDPVSMKVVTTFIIPFASCEAPQGMAIGPDHQILLGCNGAGGSNHPSVVIDDRNGHVIKTIANESGPDMVWFNDGDGHYFLARSAAVGSNQVLGVIDAESPGVWGGEQPGGDIKADPDVITATNKTASAHSVAADSFSNQVYVPIPGGVSTICSSLGGVDANGCIAVFASPNDDHGEKIAEFFRHWRRF
jgi:hypothetical protein